MLHPYTMVYNLHCLCIVYAYTYFCFRFAQGLKKLLYTVSPILYLLMFIATCQGKFTHYTCQINFSTGQANPTHYNNYLVVSLYPQVFTYYCATYVTIIYKCMLCRPTSELQCSYSYLTIASTSSYHVYTLYNQLNINFNQPFGHNQPPFLAPGFAQ